MEYRSERASTCSPLACSGERYWAVPMTAAVCVIVMPESPMARAMPKSITLTWPVRVSMTLAGLMSRWTIWARCEYSRAWRIPTVISSVRSGSSRRPECSSSRRVDPSTYSITMYGMETPST